MTDIYDRAQERDEELRDDAIAAAIRQLPHGPDHPFCECCGEPIPELRRAALPGVETCIDCQQEHEAAIAAFHR